jgi:hypothetical protein
VLGNGHLHALGDEGDLLKFVGSAAIWWALSARAQQPAKTYRLGYLASARIPNLIESLQTGLRQLDYVKGKNLKIIPIWRTRPRRLGQACRGARGVGSKDFAKNLQAQTPEGLLARQAIAQARNAQWAAASKSRADGDGDLGTRAIGGRDAFAHGASVEDRGGTAGVRGGDGSGIGAVLASYLFDQPARRIRPSAMRPERSKQSRTLGPWREFSSGRNRRALPAEYPSW